MLLGNMNLTGAKEMSGGNMMLPGHYTVKVVGVEAKETAKGTKQLLITFENQDKKTLNHYANLDSGNDFSRDWMYTFLLNLGNDMSQFNGNITSSLILNKAINITVARKFNDYSGKYFTKLIRTEKYEKEVKNEIDLVAVEQMKSEQTQQPQQQPQSNSFINSFQNPEVNNFEINDDDLPF